MATYLSGNAGVVTGPAIAANVTRWQYSDQALLPETGAMGDARDSHVVGPAGPATATIDYLMDTDATWTSAGLDAGTTGISVVLKNTATAGNCQVAGTASIERNSFDVDRRGVARGTMTVKFLSDVAITETV